VPSRNCWELSRECSADAARPVRRGAPADILFIIRFIIAGGKAGFDVHADFASNEYGLHSQGGYRLLFAFVTEVV
jgi:hypothetical protein